MRGYYFKFASAYTYYKFAAEVLDLNSLQGPSNVRDKIIRGRVPSIEFVLGRNLYDKCIPIRFDLHYIHILESTHKIQNYYYYKGDTTVFNNAKINFYSDQFLVNMYWDFFKYRWLTLSVGGGGGIGIHTTRNELVDDGIKDFSPVNTIFYARNVNAIGDVELSLNLKFIKFLEIGVFGRYTYLGLIETESRTEISSSVGDRHSQQFNVGGSINFLF